MVPKKQYLRRLNKCVKWGNTGFFDEMGECSSQYINDNMLGLEQDIGHRFKPGFISVSSDEDNDTDDDESNTSTIEDRSNVDGDEKVEEEEEERSCSDESDESDKTDEESSVEDDMEVKPPPTYPCSVCSKRFVLMSELCTHMRVKHIQNPSKRPSSTESIIPPKACRPVMQSSRVVKDVNQEAISCSICGQTFTKSCALVRHTKCQHAEKQFKCPTCSRAFSRQDAMKLHKLICKE
jgi:uncharacterized Zn-finger protein